MRSTIAHFHGRGGARILMPRPRIQSEAWDRNWREDLSNWRMLLRRLPTLLIQTRFLTILAFVLIIIIFNYLLSSSYHRELHHIKRRIEQEKKLKLVVQYQPVAIKKIIPIPPKPAPKKAGKKIAKPKPKAKPAKKKVALKPKLKPIAKAKPKPIAKPKPKPVKKKLNLEDSLNREKKFNQPLKVTKKRTIRRKIEPLVINDDLNLAGLDKQMVVAGTKKKRQGRKRRLTIPTIEENKMDLVPKLSGEKVYTTTEPSTTRRMSSHQVDIQTGAATNDTELELNVPVKKYQEINSSTDRKTHMPALADSQSAYNQVQDEPNIEVDIQENDNYDFAEGQAVSTSPPAPVNNRTEVQGTANAEPKVKIADVGISLVHLRTCGLREKKVKNKLATLVKDKGYRKECVDRTGKYQFYWPAERFTVQNFNVIIFTSEGRIATDRCEELNNACECLQNN